MKNIFLDTDILIDFLGDRKPFSRFSLTIFLNAYNKKITVYTSGNSITTAYYILSKQTTEKHARELIVGLMHQITIIPVTENILQNAFSSNFADVEDAVQFFSALTVSDMYCIVTRNIRDYRKSTIPVFSSEELLLKDLSK
ncbi:MAG: PIN domain-containing protein [Cyclobacteriaceae bacterium]